MGSEFQRIINALGYSIQGIKLAWKAEKAFKLEVVIFIVAIIIVMAFDFSNFDRVILLLPLVLVMIVELINSAIEAIVDRIGLEWHELSGRAKDYGSAAVFLSLLLAAIVWIMIFIYHFKPFGE